MMNLATAEIEMTKWYWNMREYETVLITR
jgi:hypothetical protein